MSMPDHYEYLSSAPTSSWGKWVCFNCAWRWAESSGRHPFACERCGASRPGRTQRHLEFPVWNQKIPYLDVWVVPQVSNGWGMRATCACNASSPADRPTTLGYKAVATPTALCPFLLLSFCSSKLNKMDIGLFAIIFGRPCWPNNRMQISGSFLKPYAPPILKYSQRSQWKHESGPELSSSSNNRAQSLSHIKELERIDWRNEEMKAGMRGDKF